MLAGLFAIELTAWEEEICACLSLLVANPTLRSFDSSHRERLRVGLEKLSTVPVAWARELGFSALMDSEHKREDAFHNQS